MTPPRPLRRAVLHGLRAKCPACGQGTVFDGYLAVAPRCPHCHEALHHHRADDAPPYFTIFIIGHLVVPLALALELALRPAFWVHALIWLPVCLVGCLALLRPVKGALIAMQWAMKMHGFADKGTVSGSGVDGHESWP